MILKILSIGFLTGVLCAAVAARESVWIDFGDALVSEGLTHVGRRGSPLSVDDVSAEKWDPRTVSPDDRLGIGFQVEDSFASRGNLSPLWICFEYHDGGSGEIELQVDCVGRDEACFSHPVSRFFLTGIDRWRFGTVRLTDAYFAGRQEGGADFRFLFRGTGPFVLNRVWVLGRRPDIYLATDQIPFLPTGEIRCLLRERQSGFPLGGIVLRVRDPWNGPVCEVSVPPDGRFDVFGLVQGTYSIQSLWGDGVQDEARIRVRSGRKARPREIEFRVEGDAFRTVIPSSADGSPQPCGVYIPPEYNRRESYPLIIALHGTSGNEIEFLNALRLPLPGDLGRVFVVCPYGHGNSSFEGIGETDVWDALAVVRDRFSIDADRISVIGHSMGGTAAFRLATLLPDFFASAVFVEPTVDPSLFDPSPPFAAPLFAVSFPFACISNLRDTPTYWVHAAGDLVVPVTHSRNAVEALRDLGAEPEFRELTLDRCPTWTDVLADRTILRWLLSQARSKGGGRVEFRTPSTLYSKRGWIDIERFKDDTIVAQIEAELETDNQIGVYTTGIGAFWMFVSSLQLDRRRDLAVFVDNQPVFDGPMPRDETIRVEITEPIIGPTKAGGRCGPWRRAFAGPFVYVVGTDDERDRLRQLIKSLPVEEEFFLPPGPVRLAGELDEDEKRERNLACFGTPATNRLLEELVHLTPVRLEGQRIRLGTTVLDGQGLSLHMIYPSPYANERLVQLNVKFESGSIGDFSTARYHIPDFMVLDEEGRSDPTGWKSLAAGWFTSEWSLDTDNIYLRGRDAAQD